MRHEFPVAVKRAALERSGGQCEAIGERYGLPPGVRCQRRVHPGHVQYDHYPRPAHDPDPETRSIGNCLATCPECNQTANHKVDTPREAKMKRVQRREAEHVATMAEKVGLDAERPPPRRKHKPKPIRSRGFDKGHRPILSRPFPTRSK